MCLRLFYKYYILFYCFLLVKSWTFFSNFEAYTRRGELCIGDCHEISGEKRCAYDWNAHETQCKNTFIATKKYRTLGNKTCISNCGYFDNESYQWCAVGNNKWDYCNRQIALKAKITYRTNNIKVTCSDECGLRGKSYNWCESTYGKWQYCDPKKKLLLFDYRTKANTLCKSVCEYDTDNLSYCYDENGDWKRCYLNPEYTDVLNEIDRDLRDHCNPGGFFKDGYRLCKSNKAKRQTNDLHFTCTLNVETVATRHEDNNPTVTVRQLDPNNLISDDEDPILSYTVLPTFSYFGNDQLNLPLVVRAFITNQTLNPRGEERDRFTQEINNYFRNMGPIVHHDNYDERGHIVASRLGGPMEAYNIFPQSWRHNRGSGSRWYRMETQLDEFLRGHNNRYAEYTAVLSYSTDQNNNLQHRPNGIAVRIRLYEDGFLTDRDGNRLSSYRDNILENMYFSNDPDVACY